MELFVSPTGDDSGPGTRARPLATLDAARDRLRMLKHRGTGPMTVWIRGGWYPRSETFRLSSEDSGSREVPIVYRAFPGEAVHISGGVRLNLIPLRDEAPRARLPSAAREHVVSVDLPRARVISGAPVARGFVTPITASGIELFFRGRRLPLARWPNEGWERTAAAAPSGHGFTFTGDRPLHWSPSGDVWVHGYFRYDWADDVAHVSRVDPAKKVAELDRPDSNYGYSPGQRYYWENVVEELDTPGEWVIDRERGQILLWPPEPIAQPRDDERLCASLLTTPLIELDSVSYVRVEGLTIECTRGAGVVIRGGNDDVLTQNTIRAIGTDAVVVGDPFAFDGPLDERSAGTNHQILDNEIYAVGETAIALGGGNRVTLLSGRNRVAQNHVHDFAESIHTYRPAILVHGVGQIIDHNLIEHAPHIAIVVHGNEHRIEYNEIRQVVLETNDAGAIYLGRDLSERGNLIANNYIHDLGAGPQVHAVYLDDWASGTSVVANVIVGRDVFIGGGSDNLVDNNFFVDCSPAIHVDSRGLTWARSNFDGRDDTLPRRLTAVHYRDPPYSTTYPGLAAALEDRPALAKRNHITHNVSLGGRWLDLVDGADEHSVEVASNLVGADPNVVGIARDYSLVSNSPALRLGIHSIPFRRIGRVRKRR